MESLIRKLGSLFFRIERRRDRIVTHHILQIGLYRSQHMLLMDIGNQPGVAQRDLASNRDISAAAVAVNLKKLEKMGLIRREIDPDDNRFNCVFLTPKGEEVVQQSLSIFEDLEREMFQVFSEEEKHQLEEYLKRLYDRLAYMEEQTRS